jgi:Xaa-Pro aminopeptidase
MGRAVAKRAQCRARPDPGGQRAPREIRDLRAELDEMRLIKDAAELATMRRAADLASAGHARAMRACRPGMAEYELEAELTTNSAPRRRGPRLHAHRRRRRQRLRAALRPTTSPSTTTTWC